MNEKPKFTPGPWRKVGYGALYLIKGDEPIDIAVVQPRADTSHAFANAALITAAPNMWKALRAAHDALKSYEYGNSSPELAKEIAEFAAAALAKAEGRS